MLWRMCARMRVIWIRLEVYWEFRFDVDYILSCTDGCRQCWRRFGGHAASIFNVGEWPEMETGSSKTSEHISQTTRQLTSEDSNLHSYCSENLKSHVFFCYYDLELSSTNVAPTSWIRVFAVLLMSVRNWILRRWSGLLWDKIHTKFCENNSAGSKVERGEPKYTLTQLWSHEPTLSLWEESGLKIVRNESRHMGLHYSVNMYSQKVTLQSSGANMIPHSQFSP
jgi:hypothetical protein